MAKTERRFDLDVIDPNVGSLSKLFRIGLNWVGSANILDFNANYLHL